MREKEWRSRRVADQTKPILTNRVEGALLNWRGGCGCFEHCPGAGGIGLPLDVQAGAFQLLKPKPRDESVQFQTSPLACEMGI
jgi:hypothetical protein